MLLALLLAACSSITGAMRPGADLDPASAALRAGNFEIAEAAFEAGVRADPQGLEARVGRSYLHLLSGQFDEADRLLAEAGGAHPEALPALDLRRALVALRRGDLDAVRRLGERSGLPAGRLLAAEVHLVDGDRAAARAHFVAVERDPGGVGGAARAYLALLDHPDPHAPALADAQALWAVGLRPLAVRAADAPVRALAGGGPERLLWAGRAAVVGETARARSLVEGLDDPALAWSVDAVRAHADCADGRVAECRAGLDALVGRAPADALEDARVTAASLVAERDPEAARGIVEGVRGDAAARLRRSLGEPGAADLAVDPVLRAVLGGDG